MMRISPVALFFSGVVLFAIGLLHRWPCCGRLDRRVFLALHKPLRRMLPFFQALWLLGTLPGLAAGAAAVAVGGKWRLAVVILLAYGLVVQGEMWLKRRISRQRPFVAMPGEAKMGQPRRPPDSSFPSGDALRVWLLALAVAPLLPPLWGWLAIGLAALVSLGRIALGVHYPLDVIGGTGLGFIAAALTMWGVNLMMGLW